MATADGSTSPMAFANGPRDSFGRRASPPIIMLPPPAPQDAPGMTVRDALDAVFSRLRAIAAAAARDAAPDDGATMPGDAAAPTPIFTPIFTPAPSRPLRPVLADHVIRGLVKAQAMLRTVAARRDLAARREKRPRERIELFPLTDLRRLTLQFGAYAAVLCALAWGGLALLRSPTLSDIDATAKPDWVEIERPFSTFEVAVPDFAANAAHYAVMKHASGGGRRDIISWGTRTGEGPHFLIEAYRPGDEFDGFKGTMAALAASAVIPVKSIRSLDFMDSKFGPVSLAAFPASEATPGRMCLGFVRQFEHPTFAIVGWQCGDGLDLRDHHVVACALDRLSLLASGSDARLAALFARAELQRDFCGQRQPLLAATPRYSRAADDGAAGLRSQISAY